MHLLYLIGAPGAGKSTLMARLVQGKRRRVVAKPFYHTCYEDGLVQLGRERAQFSGTDVLSMSVSPVAKAALDARLWHRIVGEGDRLANAGFFDQAKASGYELEVVYLKAPEDVLEARRAQRGSDQDPSWLAGRVTKVERLAENYATLTLDASDAIESLAMRLSNHPVFRA